MAMKKGMFPPNVGQLKKYAVNRPGAVESVYQPVYDFQTYAAAGQTSLTFFALPIGQGGKTAADTNMEAAGQLPSPKRMLVTGIEVVFFPGTAPSHFGAQAAAVNINDVYEVAKSGYLDFFIGSKSYLTDAPVGKFPPSFRMAGMAAVSDASTAAANQQTQTDYATMAGSTYEITPVELPSNQNFNVTLNWPGAVALPSGVNGRIGIILNGFQYRLSQ